MVQPRTLKNDNETGELFIRPLVFHNTKTNRVILLFGVCEDGKYLGVRFNFADSHILKNNVTEFDPDTFWKGVSLEEVKEIDVLALPGLKR